jgi:predicted HicB family RNase H-like nuclease
VARANTNEKRSNGPRMVHVRLDPELHRRLRVIVAAEDTSVQEWVARVIEKAVGEKWSSTSN